MLLRIILVALKSLFLDHLIPMFYLPNSFIRTSSGRSARSICDYRQGYLLR